MLVTMTNDIRTAIKEYLDLSHTSQKELAEAANRHHMHVNKVITGAGGNLPGVWEDSLKALGLKLVVIPEDTDFDALALIRQKALAVRGSEKRLKKLGKKKASRAKAAK